MFFSPSRSMCAWPSMSPGITVLPRRSTIRVAGAMCAAMAASGPTATMRSPAMAIAWAIVKAASTVMTLPFLSMISAGGYPPGLSRLLCSMISPSLVKATGAAWRVRWRLAFGVAGSVVAVAFASSTSGSSNPSKQSVMTWHSPAGSFFRLPCCGGI